EVSSDGGLTWKRLVRNQREIYSLERDLIDYGFTSGDQYLVKVTATDGIYETSDTSDAVFTFTDIPEEITTTQSSVTKVIPETTTSETVQPASFDLIGLATAAIIIFWISKRKNQK
ncbi:MAG: hypothetical protein ACFFCU_15825, partial [Promethearchaeota archaeon]